MFRRTIAISFGAILLGGCAGPGAQPALTSTHPASPDAPEAPVPLRSPTIALNGVAEMRIDEVSPEALKPQMGHDMHHMDHGEHGGHP